MKQRIQSAPRIILLLTYAEVFGGPPLTLVDFRDRLATLPKVGLVRVCSALNAFLRPDVNSNEVLKLTAHRALVRAYFPAEIASKVLQLEQSNPSWVVFHRQQMLFIIKEALQYASDNPALNVTNSALGEIFLIANDHMHFDVSDSSSDTFDSFAKLATTLLPIQEEVSGNARHKILRSYQMTKAAPEFSTSEPYFDLFALFKVATGLELMNFYALILAAMSRFSNFDPNKYIADPLSYSLDEHWFSSTKASSEVIQAFFKLTSATPEEYIQLLKTNKGPNDFTAFRDKPMIRASSKLDVLDYWMLAEKFESGPFWAIHSALNAKQRDAFHSFWGRLFEKYIADVFKNSVDGKLNRAYISPFFQGTSEELSDTVIVCGQSVVLIESKSATFAAKAKYEGSYKTLREALESKLVESEDRPQAIKQLVKNIERAFGAARRPVEGLDLRYVRSVFPVLITRDDLGDVPGVNGFLGLRFKELLNRKAIPVSVAPLTCMSSEVAEAISPYLTDTSLVAILEAHIRANRKGQTRYLTMPFFAVPNAVLAKKGKRQTPDQVGNLDALIQQCLSQLGIVAQERVTPTTD